LIKRVVANGVVTNSTTETIPPRHVQERVIKPAPAQVQRVPEPIPETVPEMAATVPPTEVKRSDMAVQGDDKPMCNGCCRGMSFFFSYVLDILLTVLHRSR
jgi:next-to-BRCA1 protein 1